jgi:ribonuclease T1
LPRAGLKRKAPAKAYELLEALERRNGEPLPGYVGGKVFRNRERRLPSGRYKEYDVNRRAPGRSRDAERLVIEQETGKAYYTNDHYRTFVPLN